MLTVIPKISFTDNDINQTIKVGNATNLSINFIGNPKPTLAWTFNNEPLQESDHLKLTTSMDHSIIEVKNASMKEKGKYRVEATNNVGSDSITFNLTVIGKQHLSQNFEIIF